MALGQIIPFIILYASLHQHIYNTYICMNIMYSMTLTVVTSFEETRDEIFDYNTRQCEENENYKSTVIHLQLPKPNQELNYFIHKSTNKLQKKRFIYVQRRKQFLSDISQSDLNPKKYTLTAGIKLFYKRNQRGSTELLIKCYKATEIPTNNGCTQLKDDGLPYYVVRSFGNGFPLSKNQSLKMGRTEYELVQVQSKPDKKEYFNSLQKEQILELQPLPLQPLPLLSQKDQKQNSDEEETSSSQSSKIEKVQQVEKIQVEKVQVVQNEVQKKSCRICYSHDDTEQDRIIHPCKCQSSIGYVHINCFKNWMNMRISKMKGQSQNGGAYHASLLTCEICKQTVPKVIKIGEKMIPILNFVDNFKPYLGFAQKGLPLPCNDHNNPVVYITMDDDNKTTIGRLPENGVSIQEPTVSRRHAIIQINSENKFVIKDTESKYGTLIYDKDAEVKVSKHLKAFQIKNTVFAFQMERK